jgi:gamma-glutamyl phosphate reductase
LVIRTRSMEPIDIAKASKEAFEASQAVGHNERVDALSKIKEALRQNKATILEANKLDVQVGFSSSSIDTLFYIDIWVRQPPKK